MATLIINPSESKCGACNKGTDPHAERHMTVLSMGPRNGTPGCGELFTEVTTTYVGATGLVASIQAMRPDLPYVGPDWDKLIVGAEEVVADEEQN